MLSERSSQTAAFAKRHSPASLPRRAPISNLDLDVTEGCNLRCVYCFKGEKGAKQMTLPVAKAAIDWLFEACGAADQMQVNFMGGEPMLKYHDLCVPLVLYGKRKGACLGKQIVFTATTNMTLITPEMVEFWDRWNNGWLCSIDGTPDLQDAQRPFADGRPSHEAVERGARLILSTRPHLPARSTVHPSNVHQIAAGFRYLVALGFKKVMMATAAPEAWDDSSLQRIEQQLAEIRDEIVGHFRRGEVVALSAFDYVLQELLLPESDGREAWFIPMSCGAGRGTVLIDPEGNIWPCHRFNGADRDAGAGGAFCLGNIFGEFNDDLQQVFLQFNHARFETARCKTCRIRRICGGGCPAANLQEMGDIYQIHENHCEMVEIYHRQSLLLHEILSAERSELWMKHIDTLRRTARSAAPPQTKE
jgi:uncharacterized protein